MKFFTSVIFLHFLVLTSLFSQSKDIIDWKTDLEYLKTELPIMHSNLFFQVSQAEYNAAIENLKKQAGVISNDCLLYTSRCV